MVDRPSDEILAKKAQEGDLRAFEELFNIYKKPILNFVFRLIGNRETAEEVTQEVFINVYKNLDVFDPKRKFSTWLYTIARNLTKNSLRDKKYFRDRSLEEVVAEDKEPVMLKDFIADPGPRPDSIVEEDELAEDARKVLDSLPFKYKEIITLCGLQGLTYREVAEILGRSVAAISMRMNKAKKLFMEKLGIKNQGKK
jgi:RNA polymerase sigma-70 factor (ECF subfamily)